ncbi:hypothetical protein DFJ67_5874 [Asanoa ferruginea]|uniref:Uncharacterized protein n=1 Tax=Asanoa ferruginea TaxID=53367 RepID=A0A3E0A0X5_9ACTN|nr:hypothetical protein [Asanoa ferruginea]REF99830.1 hypothetical protein DFJ67_5874 [Asanoa ferruginea]GIF51848.1 hypothetical protein Afe04nite_63870 [Asanoa ferruginea]
MSETLPIPHTVLSSDVVDSSPGGYPRHAELGQTAEAVITEAIQELGANENWPRSNRGDGEVTLAPATVPAARLLADFLRLVHDGLVTYNRNKSVDHRLRLRFGVDHGDVVVDGGGVPRGGDPLVVAARLRDSAVAYEALAAVPSAPVVAVVSDLVYQRAVPANGRGLEVRMFRRVETTVSGRMVSCWLYVPGHEPPVVTEATPSPRPAARSAAAESPAAPSRTKASKSGAVPRESAKYRTSIKDSHNIHIGDDGTHFSVERGGPA